jgi:hypothetical protein
LSWYFSKENVQMSNKHRKMVESPVSH